MLFAHEYGKVRVIDGGVEITQRNVRGLRTRVELALAASERVVLDLRRSETIDSWGFLALFDLYERYGDRLAVVAPAYLRDVLGTGSALGGVRVYERIAEALAPNA